MYTHMCTLHIYTHESKTYRMAFLVGEEARHEYMYTHTYVHTYIYIYIDTHSIYIHTYVYICIYTHTSQEHIGWRFSSVKADTVPKHFWGLRYVMCCSVL